MNSKCAKARRGCFSKLGSLNHGVKLHCCYNCCSDVVPVARPRVSVCPLVKTIAFVAPIVSVEIWPTLLVAFIVEAMKPPPKVPCPLLWESRWSNAGATESTTLGPCLKRRWDAGVVCKCPCFCKYDGGDAGTYRPQSGALETLPKRGHCF